MITEEIKRDIQDKKGLVKKVIKRNGEIVDFKKEKIQEAIF